MAAGQFLLLLTIPVLLYCIWLPYSVAQRNAKEEAICAPFLTSPRSSPLIDGLARNLKYDEDAEFSCELVLQDVQLPKQIRLTVHEGLYYLAVRHIHLGLHRERTAVRHAKQLAAIVPDNFRFQYYLGSWSIHHEVGDATTAESALRQCLYGKASMDATITASEKFNARRDYISALLALDRQEDAMKEIEVLLDANPFDFEAAFLWKTYYSAHTRKDDKEWSPKYTEELEHAISSLVSHHSVSYPALDHCQELPPSNQPIVTIDHMTSATEFESILQQRVPVKIAAGSVKAVSEALQWSLHDRWYQPNSPVVDFSYLKSRIGDEEDVLVESTRFTHCDHDAQQISSETTTADYDKPCVAFGLSLGSARRSKLFHTVLDQQFQDLNTLESFYLNVQNAGSGETPYRPPLHLLKDDLPIAGNDSFLRLIRENLTDINLWMSENRLQSSISPHPHRRPTASRLHRDANDNLYMVLQGEKRFSLWHPCHYRDMQTLSPSYHVNSDGLATQFNVNSFKSFLEEYVNEQLETFQHANSMTGQNATSQQDINDRNHAQQFSTKQAFVANLHPMLQQLLAPTEANVKYETVNLHFSQKSSHAMQSSSTPLPAPTTLVSIQPGDLLYLPTGWFHEVTSMPGRHIALNLWWKPPHWQTALGAEFNAERHLFVGLIEYFQRLKLSKSIVHEEL